MESLLSYYYGLNVTDIKYKKDYYIINTENNIFLLCELQENIEDLEKIIDILNNTNIQYHLLVLTKEKNLYITYEGKNYCLLKVRCNLNNKVSLLTFNNVIEEGLVNWADIWSKRVDYYENQIDELIKEPNIKYAMEYYIGLTEIAIYYANNLKEIYHNNDLKYTISHKLISSPSNPLDFYNPLNMIIDLEVRDLAEYFKASFFNETLTDSELLNLIDSFKYSEPMANYLFLRLLYPSYFFYLYDDYIETKNIDPKMILYIKKSRDYESLLTKVYFKLKINYDIKIRLWFIKAPH